MPADKSLLDVTYNLKYKTILTVIYSASLRVSEASNLKVTDIDSRTKAIKVCGGKGNKDRFTLLSDTMLVLLRQYYKIYRPQFRLFEG